MTSQTFRQLARLTALLAFAVVVLGAYVRLTDAGLGCPDWPGCYGKLTVTEVMRDVSSAEAAFPERAVDAGKAWREMIHRYLAAILGLAIVALAVIAWRRRHIPGQPVALPIALVGLVIFQGLLGMWTVTLLLKPVVVMAHLLGGMTTLALLWWLSLSPPTADSGRHRLTSLALAGVAVVIVQIALGGWTSTNYAALACPAFPSCNGNWWPEMDFAEGFRLWRGLGVDYEGGVLHNSARMAIHYSHRIFALAVIIVLG
ncbi:MAG: COX15/CtaA family protein, partial [Chromatiales bacterium]|nr:COX15/CtaA family protein [Chromatiales bacterium]